MKRDAKHAGEVVISAVVLLTFGFMLWLVVTKPIPEANTDIAKVMLGQLSALAAGVVWWWMGSNRSSKDKDATIAASSPVTPGG